jgi:phosphate-selective porin OprO/OprP
LSNANTLRVALLAAIGALTLATPVLAQDLTDRERQLEETVRRQGEVIAALEARLNVVEARASVQMLPPQPVAIAAAPAPLAGATTAKWRGRLHADAWAVKDGASGTELRRARLGVEGKISGAFNYVLEVDFAGNAVSLQDAFVDYGFSPTLTARLGYHKVPFSLDDQTSDNYNLFMEHPVGIDPFVPGRGVGAAVLAKGSRWFATAGVFGEGENDSRDGAVDENLTVGGRAVFAPILNDTTAVHLAVAGYRTGFGDQPAFQLRERPERHLAPYAVSTGAIDADNLTALGLEAAFTHGPFGASAEYAAVNLEDRLDRELGYSGYSLEGWWTLTGEHRPYKLNGGTFDRMVPARPTTEGGFGAWQIAARYSALDLDDKALAAGKLSTVSLGVNWHLTDRMRLMVDVNRAKVEKAGVTTEQNGLGGRVQVDW